MTLSVALLRWHPVQTITLHILQAHGTVFRFPRVWPHEAMVDLMLFDNSDELHPHGLIACTGQKAGLILALLPPESGHPDLRGVRAEWLVSEWTHWIYPECPVGKVQVLRRYVAPIPGEM
ncbi:Imm45 family immunity protein [Stenotrophomonas maltophilia]|uniref:Imm45 family immunity protein n=1 Tax=Stenotrophomonas maltophilia TaxID=40324 RepID=UPI000749D008|nr:hypothetical protein [Stenotrophomonas maltophilia]EKT4075318.1 hypothetical protein [Stenotrophomonas maltophilia]EKT4083482.1 hypothetical protein [Stenotrophomonas maltophilia]KUP00812.1 hypothetical protein AR274_21850 [Stenotrophomonas maltophilia]MBA0290740.1 hypothetical protein [Stenotrophomonas maltophilia]